MNITTTLVSSLGRHKHLPIMQRFSREFVRFHSDRSNANIEKVPQTNWILRSNIRRKGGETTTTTTLGDNKSNNDNTHNNIDEQGFNNQTNHRTRIRRADTSSHLEAKLSQSENQSQPDWRLHRGHGPKENSHLHNSTIRNSNVNSRDNNDCDNRSNSVRLKARIVRERHSPMMGGSVVASQSATVRHRQSRREQAEECRELQFVEHKRNPSVLSIPLVSEEGDDRVAGVQSAQNERTDHSFEERYQSLRQQTGRGSEIETGEVQGTTERSKVWIFRWWDNWSKK